MCLYPKTIRNRKYVANKKNGGVIPAITDKRMLEVPVGCGRCMQCKKQRASGWKIRLEEEIKSRPDGLFITLTFNNESIAELLKHERVKRLDGYEKDNEIATVAVRLFLERWRKEHKVSLRHWLITELGGGGTENIHLHGIVWTAESNEKIAKIWKYGYVWSGYNRKRSYVNGATANYITKYILKSDVRHPGFTGKILTSAGIGAGYEQTTQGKASKFNDDETKDYYRDRQGNKKQIPAYYRKKIYNDDERESLWKKRLDEGVIWIGGRKMKIEDQEKITMALKQERIKNKQLGFGTDEHTWEEEERIRIRRKEMYEKRLNATKAKNKYKE